MRNRETAGAAGAAGAAEAVETAARPGSAAFHAAYDTVVAKWPQGTESRTVPTPFGVTHVLECGPRDGTPLVLLPGGGATAATWFANVAELSRTHRVHAVDLIGEPGRSVPGERPIRAVADLDEWLDALLGGLGIGPDTEVDLCGHSYGGWIALHHALHAPARVRRLVLVDPTQCFAGFRANYLLRALPALLRPSARRTRAFLAWETGGVRVDADWLELQELAWDFPAVRPVTGPRPAAERVRELTAPVLLLLAGRGRAQDHDAVAARAAALLPDLRAAVLPGLSHHALPHAAPAELNRRMGRFLRA